VAEKADDIDIARAEEAKRRAEQMLKDRPAGVDIDSALASLRRAQIRLTVAQKRGRHAGLPEMRREQ
jgi:F-type H+-transporting ATPase subunit epsilon